MRPILFHIPLFIGDIRLPVYGYGAMLALSLIVGWYIVLGLCQRDGMSREQSGKLYMWTAIAAVAGARLLYVFTNLGRFDNPIDILKVNQGGLVAYGGFLGGFLFGIVYCRMKGISLLAWADCVVPALGSGLMLTRVGCLLFGCDFGKPAPGLGWAIRFPKDSPAWAEQVKHGLLSASEMQSLPVHPTQIYESLIGLVLFVTVMIVRRYRKFSGEMFLVFTMGYAVLRFFVETLRADEQRGEIGPFSTSQAIGILTFVLAAAFFAHLWRIYRRDPKALRMWEPKPATVPAAPARKRRKKR